MYGKQNQLSTQVAFALPQLISGSLAMLLSPKVLAPCDSDSVQVRNASPWPRPMATPVQPYKMLELRTALAKLVFMLLHGFNVAFHNNTRPDQARQPRE
jgi:hypothetical protein